MSPRPVKHSLTISGHRTSVSLEDAFWQALRAIAAERGQPLNALAAEIDAARDPDTGLASAIRLFVLAHYRARAERPCGADGGGRMPPAGVFAER
ncbi:MAG: hypothetical protein Kow0058_09720 [Roseovarius sp.]